MIFGRQAVNVYIENPGAVGAEPGLATQGALQPLRYKGEENGIERQKSHGHGRADVQ